MGSRISFALSALAICLFPMTELQAQPISTQGFVDIGTPTANTDSILTATSFTFGNLVTTTSSSGIFTGMPAPLFFGSVPFDVTIPTGLNFSNPVFGTFGSSSIMLLSSTPLSIAYSVTGEFTPGSFPESVGVTGGPFPALATVGFNQNGGPGTAIAVSFSFATSAEPSVVPEPSSFAMLLAGLAGIVASYGICRRRLPLAGV